jgi:hypothetical protein
MPRAKHFILTALLMLIVLSASSQITLAQDSADACQTLLTKGIQSVQESCSGLAPGNACTSTGSTIALGDVDTLQTTALSLDANQWDSALIKIATDDQPIAMALFGGAEITNTAQSVAPTSDPLMATNKSGYNVNLRQGPGKDFDVAGFFSWDKTAVVDGRSADGYWLRLQTATGFAWVASDLVSVDGEINSLPILSGDSSPMQQFRLNTPENSVACGLGAAGLLVSHPGTDDVGLQINGASLTFGKAILLLRAQPNTQLQIDVIDGTTDVNASGQNITAKQGETAEIPLGGSDGLEVSDAPQVKPSYPFNTILGIPLELVSDESLDCMAGLAEGGVEAPAYVRPNPDTAVAETLVADAHYRVLGWLQDDQGERWWQLEQSWVRQNDVQIVGACDAVAEITADATTASTTNMSTSGPTQSLLFNSSLVPTGDTIWTADPGHDILSGTCVTPPLPVCAHPVAITPSSASLSWRGQEPLPYSLSMTGDNTYAFNGRNHLNNANVSMSLTFTSTGSWTMTMTQVFDNDPSCIHTLYYNAVPR